MWSLNASDSNDPTKLVNSTMECYKNSTLCNSDSEQLLKWAFQTYILKYHVKVSSKAYLLLICICHYIAMVHT